MIRYPSSSLRNHTARFHWSPSISKPHMTPVFFVKTTKLYEDCRLDHHVGSTFTGTGKNGTDDRICPESLVTIIVIAVKTR